MVDSAKRICKVKNNHIRLKAIVNILGQLIHQFDELSLTRALGSKSVLVGNKDMMLFLVCHDVGDQDMLYDLTADACQGYGPVVACFIMFSFLIDWGDVGRLPG